MVVTREVRERTVKNLAALKLRNEDIHRRSLTLVDQPEVFKNLNNI